MKSQKNHWNRRSTWNSKNSLVLSLIFFKIVKKCQNPWFHGLILAVGMPARLHSSPAIWESNPNHFFPDFAISCERSHAWNLNAKFQYQSYLVLIVYFFSTVSHHNIYYVFYTQDTKWCWISVPTERRRYARYPAMDRLHCSHHRRRSCRRPFQITNVAGCSQRSQRRT